MRKICSVMLALAMMVSGLVMLPVQAASVAFNGWTKNGNYTLYGNQITITTTEEGQENTVALPAATIENFVTDGSFDVSWSLKVDAYSGSENFQIRTGTSRFYLILAENSLSCFTTNEAGASKTVGMPYNVGYRWHTYRAISKDGVCSLFVDDVFLKTFALQQYASEKNIQVWNMGREGKNSCVSLKDVVISAVSGENTTMGSYSPATVTDSANYTFDSSGIGRWPVQTDTQGNTYLEGKVTTAGGLNQAFTSVNFGGNRDLTLKMRVRFPEMEGYGGVQLFWPGRKLYADFYPDQISYRGGGETSTGLTLNDGQWHDFKIETRSAGTEVTYSLDGVVLENARTLESDRTDLHLFFFVQQKEITGNGTTMCMQIDSIQVETQTSVAKMLLPYHGAAYRQGEEISLLTVPSKEENIPSLDYKIGGKTVATGTAPGYRATLPELPAGEYFITAEYGGKVYSQSMVRILREITGSFQAERKGDKLNLNLSLTEEDWQEVALVEYWVAGQMVGTSTKPETLSVKGLPKAECYVTAVCKNKAGVSIATFTEKAAVEETEVEASTHYANEISYTVAGSKGTAEIKFQNGNHLLWLQHSADKVLYQTASGMESFSGAAGVGSFVILTDGPYAEVYRNGQLAFTYLMPKSENTKNCFYENGLLIQNYRQQIPKERQSYYVERQIEQGEQIVPLDSLPYAYVLDFVAEASDKARMVVSDGVFQTDIALEDGKVFVWTKDNDTTEPKRVELCKAVEGTAYYRVEVVGGMCRLYGDGLWLASYRCINAEGAKTLAVQVADGELSYLGVHDNRDVYLYQDDFSNDGHQRSRDYWQLTGMTSQIYRGSLLLKGNTGNEDVAELTAYVGEADLSADVQITSCTGGFWLLSSHSLSEVFVKVGYNFATGNYEVVEKKATETATYTVAGEPLPLNQTVHMDYKVRSGKTPGKVVSLYVDGKLVLEREVSLEQHGRIGFMIKSGNALVDNVSYRGDALPVLDVSNNTTIGGRDFIEDADGGIVGITNNAVPYRTTDGGKTWTTVGADKRQGDSSIAVQLLKQDPATGKVIPGELSSEIVSALREPGAIEAEGNYYTYYSNNYGATWTKRKNPIMEFGLANRVTMPNRIIQGRSGRLYFPSCENNNEDFGYTAVYYSDDKGETWKKSQTDLDAKKTGFCIQEVMILEMLSGETRAYFRNEFGMVCYFVSENRGETWDLTPHRTPFLSALNCFGIEYDPHDMTTLYIAWGYDNANLHKTNQHPRRRWALARSTDDGETWEYLGTVHEDDYLAYSFTTMNLVAHVTEDYLIAEAMSDHDRNPDSWVQRNIGVSKPKQTGSVRFAQLHSIYDGEVESCARISKDKIENALVVVPQSGAVLSDGRWRKDAVYQGKVLAESLAEFVSATIKANSDGSISFCYANAEIVVSADKVLAYQGRYYIDPQAFSEAFSKQFVAEDDYFIIGDDAGWSDAEKDVLEKVINPFQPIK